VTAARWSIRTALRADEDSIFVRAGMLADAVVGDAVEVSSDDDAVTRRGRIVDRQHDPTRGDFLVVELDQPQ
jgi:hypothetical protein